MPVEIYFDFIEKEEENKNEDALKDEQADAEEENTEPVPINQVNPLWVQAPRILPTRTTKSSIMKCLRI